MKKAYMALLTAVIILSLSSSLIAQSFSKDITKVDVGQTKEEVESVMGPPEATKNIDGISMSMWNVSTDNIAAILIGYGKDGKVGKRMVVMNSTFDNEMKQAMEYIKIPPQVKEKDRVVWKADDIYIVLKADKNGTVSISTCTEEMYGSNKK